MAEFKSISKNTLIVGGIVLCSFFSTLERAAFATEDAILGATTSAAIGGEDSKEAKVWEVGGGATVNFATASSNFMNSQSFSADLTLGYMLDNHWELMFQPSYVHNSWNSVDDQFGYKAFGSSHSFSLLPGIAYNFSADTENSFVVKALAGIRLSIYNHESNILPETNSSLSTFGWNIGVGKRVALGAGISYFPFIEYNGASDTTVFVNSFAIYPLNISIWL